MKLGLMWYPGDGENYIEHNPLDEIDHASDRACALVVAAVCEKRLEQALKRALVNHDQKVIAKTFKSDGPLGAFGSKINMCYLLGLISADAYRDLDRIRDIRNDFAHKFEHHSFNDQSIAARCSNLTLPDKHYANVDEIVKIEDVTDPHKISELEAILKLPGRSTFTYLQSGLSEAITDPRSRYTAACMLVANSIALYLLPRLQKPLPYI